MKEVMAYEVKQQTGILLNANELYTNLNNELLPQFIDEISKIEFNRYPDTDCVEIRRLYAECRGVAKEEILVGNGSDELIGLLEGIFLGKGKSIFTLIPDFSMYEYYASMNEGKVIGYKTKEDGSFCMLDFIADAKKQDISMIMFSNPNNPTGYYVKNDELIQLVDAFPKIPVIIDEAYGEFAEESMIKCINLYSNLYITRTLSKAYGLAAARIGFLISNKKNIEFVKSRSVPYTVNSISQKLGEVVLKNTTRFKNIIEEIKIERDRLYLECNNKFKQNYCIYKSSANFLFMRSHYKDLLLNEFKNNNIVVRNFDDETLRVTIGSKRDNELIKSILLKFNLEGKGM